MENYFRITAYHPAENICAVFDSNGRFEKLWQFSSYLIQKGFKIIEVGADDKFDDGDFDRAPAETDKNHLTRLRKWTARHQWQHHSGERQMLHKKELTLAA